MVNFPTQIHDCDSHNPALFYLFLSSDASTCYIMVFRSMGNSEHVAVSVSIDFPSNSKRYVPFHRVAYDYSCADWDCLCDHLRDAPWKDILGLVLLMLLVNFVSGFRLELMYISVMENIRSSLKISMVFSCLWTCPLISSYEHHWVSIVLSFRHFLYNNLPFCCYSYFLKIQIMVLTWTQFEKFCQQHKCKTDWLVW